jgi:citrate lyase subunit beta / citryl-CoA lyase
MSNKEVTQRTWPFRSVLFTPGHKPDWIRKTPKYDPDAVILDLEDSVPPELKPGARATVKDGIGFLKSVGIGAFVRINPFDKGGADDVKGIMTPGLTAICLPKLSNVGQVRELSEVLSYAEGAVGMLHGTVDIIALPETAEGLCDIRLLAGASKRVKSIMSAIIDRASEDVVFTGDTAVAAGFVPTKEGLEQVYLTSKMCMESRAGGAPYPLATILGTDLNDPEATRKIAARIKATGFTGCVAIHPSHIAVANQYFRPSEKEVEFSAEVLNAMKVAETKGVFAVTFRGIMIDQANVEIAQRTIAEARRYGMAIPELK